MIPDTFCDISSRYYTKILIISDSHGHLANLKHVMGFAEKYNVSAVIHAGDWDSIDAVEAVVSFGIPLYTVLGNADIRPEVVEKLRQKSGRFGEQFLILELDGKKIGVTHKPSDNKKYFSDEKLDLIVNGHRHYKDEAVVNGVSVIRPGGIIRGINFAVFDTVSGKVEFIGDDNNE